VSINLEDYIRESFIKGLKKPQIEASLLQSGWTKEQIEDAFERIEFSQKEFIERHRKSIIPSKKFFAGLVKLIVIIFVITTVLGGLFYVYLHSGANGYREELFENYGFSTKAKWRLRLTTFFSIPELKNKHLPRTFTHSQANLSSRVITSGSANDELAIHEISHMIWYDATKNNRQLRVDLIKDLYKLTYLNDEEFKDASKFAKGNLIAWCKCPNEENIEPDKTDDGHLYVMVNVYTMGKFKDGKRKLPQFMWKYPELTFSGNVNITPCYETNSCEHFKPVEDSNKLEELWKQYKSVETTKTPS